MLGAAALPDDPKIGNELDTLVVEIDNLFAPPADMPTWFRPTIYKPVLLFPLNDIPGAAAVPADPKYGKVEVSPVVDKVNLLTPLVANPIASAAAEYKPVSVSPEKLKLGAAAVPADPKYGKVEVNPVVDKVNLLTPPDTNPN